MVVPEPKLSSKNFFSLLDVAKHNKRDDCWLIIRGKVYDVSSWAKNHPGGDLIFLRPGDDVTQMFESYHPLWVRKTLKRFYIGDLYVDENERHIEFAEESEFYKTCKKRVEEYFRERKISSRGNSFMFFKTGVTLAYLVLSYFMTFFILSNVWAQAVVALFLGHAIGMCCLNIIHDAGHGAYSANSTVHRLGNFLQDFLGYSSFMWKQQHDVGHHQYTNLHDADPDIRSNPGIPDVWCLNEHQNRKFFHAYQHIYLSLLYGFLSFKHHFVDDFKTIATGKLGPVPVRVSAYDISIILFGKVLFVSYMVIIPSFFLPVHRVLLLFVLSEIATGYYTALIFQVAHVTEHVAFLKPDSTGRVAVDWATMQMMTTADFAPTSKLWTFISGGLNFQVVHHLFPAISHVYYPEIQPIIKKTAKEFGVPYHCNSSFTTALAAHFRHLQVAGLGESFMDMHIG